MAVFKVETKNQNEVEKKPRVYFTCHPDDFEKYFKKICDDIFKTHDCAIYYTENMSDLIEDDEKEVDLGRNNLFVVPVTYKLLCSCNRAMDEDVPYAIKEHIPVLPIMMETGIDIFYSQHDKFGELQYLNPYSDDLTEISYDEKLKKYLESVLISDELAKRVRAAFDAYIFLSYRKKDRKYANELMKLIHSNPECRDIAIWFDEFLTPGESFKENIAKILKDSKLFALLVTPNLLEMPNGNPNFVMGEEYPAARESGIEILPAEMENTDKFELNEKFSDLPLCVDPHDDLAFRNRLLETISRLAIKTNNTPEHNFLIGLAYLDGIDVDVDRARGMELITSAAEDGVQEAMEKLCNIYNDGIGTNVNYQKVIFWLEKLLVCYKKEFGDKNEKTLTILNNLAVTYGRLSNHEKAYEMLKKAYKLSCKLLGKKHNDTLTIQNNIAVSYTDFGDRKKTIKMHKKIYKLKYKTFGENHPTILSTLNNMVVVYDKMGNYKKAIEVQETVCEKSLKLFGEEHPNTLTFQNNLSVLYIKSGDINKAYNKLKKTYETRCKVLGEEHPETLDSLGNLSVIYSNRGDYQKALESDKKVYDLRCKLLGEEHQYSLIALNRLADAYGKCGDSQKEMEMQEKAYEMSSRILGEEHIETLHVLNNLAMTYGEVGEYEKAVMLHEKTYKSRLKTLGEMHPDTLTSLHNIAFSYYKLKDYKKALEINEKVYKLNCDILGENHPKTLVTLNNLASSYLGIGENKRALILQEKAYKSLSKIFPAKHLTHISCLSILATCYKANEDYKAAQVHFEKLLNILTKVYGADHPKTKYTLKNLNSVRAKL